MEIQFIRLAAAVAIALLGAPSLVVGAPIILPDTNCFAAPAGSSCASIGYTEGPFGNPTDERSFAVIVSDPLFGSSEIRAGNELLGDPRHQRLGGSHARAARQRERFPGTSM